MYTSSKEYIQEVIYHQGHDKNENQQKSQTHSTCAHVFSNSTRRLPNPKSTSTVLIN